MSFERSALMAAFGIVAYAATARPWSFMIIQDLGKWSASYRLLDEHIGPGQWVSASSTIMGPFDEFVDAANAAEAKLAELRMLQ